jgi:hypothetical protein
MHEFSRAGEIIDVLRSQFAFMFAELLGVWQQLRERSGDRSLSGLHGQGLRLALERPPAWELLLFSQILIDGVADVAGLRREHEETLAIELGEDVADPISWVQFRFDDLKRLVDSLNSLIKNSVAGAFAPDTHTLDGLVFAAQSIVRIYVTFLKWSRRVRTANLDAQFEELRRLLARFADDAIAEIANFGQRMQSTIHDALALPEGHPDRKVNLVLKLTLSNADAFHHEMECLRRRI